MPEKPLQPWDKEEVILALSLFVEGGGKTYGEDSKEIIELSEQLRSEYFCPDGLPNQKHRNPAGVAMQVASFVRLDETDRKGLTAGQLFQDVWNEYSFNKHGIKSSDANQSIKKLRRDADTILNRLKHRDLEQKTWIFQWNPKKWGDEEFLEELHPGYYGNWSANQSYLEMSHGDRMLLWKAGDDAGIYALGTLRGDVFTRKKSDQINQSKDIERAINFEIDHIVDPPLLKEQLKKIPGLKDLRVIKFPNATNFKVSHHESKLLEDLMFNETSWVYVNNGPGKWTITKQGVHKAIEESIRIGRKKFLSKYGFGESTTYCLKYEDEIFDPKAITGVAYKWSNPEKKPLTKEQLSGGRNRGHANWCLSELGFQIVKIDTVIDIEKGKESSSRTRDTETGRARIYEIPPRGSSKGQRKEADLQNEYKKYLEKKKHKVLSYELRSAGGRRSLVDLFDESTNELYEAKSSSAHEYVWKAIGQVSYYAHLLDRTEVDIKIISILLPSRPEDELLEVMKKLKIVCVYKQNNSFKRVEVT